MNIAFDVGIILLTSLVIYYTGGKFSVYSSNLGDYLRLPKSVKGVTFDAISSSMPELMIALFSVIFFHRFDVGIGTITGSALFNLLIIPAICVLISPAIFKVSKEVEKRDDVFYIISVAMLLGALLFSKNWSILIPLIFILVYVIYGLVVVKDTKKFQEKHKVGKKIKLGKTILGVIFTVAFMAIGSYYLTESAIGLAYALNIPPLVISFTVIAAATSVPDMVISIANAKKGNIDAAASNVFGSNIFDILIGLSIPVLIMALFVGKVAITFTRIELVVGLLVSAIAVYLFLGKNYRLDKKHAWMMLGIYALFIIYVVYLALKGIVS